MKKLTSALTVGALAVITGGAILAGPGSASALGAASPWAPGGISQDPNAVGGIAFFNAAGTQITGGSLTDQPFAKYAVGLAQTRAGDTKGTLIGFTPVVGQAPDTWGSSEQIGLSTTYPPSGAPAPVNGTTLPVNTGNASDESLGTLDSNLGNASTTAGYQHVYEIRLLTSSAGNGVAPHYDYADISVDTAAGTWTEVWSPDQASTATSSALGSSATSTTTAGPAVTLTDTITPSGATGTVQFKDGATNIGTPVTVSGGVATQSASFSTAGTHHITAVFTPAALSGFGASTSNNVDIAVTQVATNTTTALSRVFAPYTPNSDSSIPAFTPTTLTATITPSTAAGTVQFFDASAAIGTATVSGGTATLTNYANFGPGAHSITATFTPTDTASFNSSISAAVTFIFGAAAGAAPDQQYISADIPAGSLAITTPYDSTNPLNVGTLVLNAAGDLLSGTVPFGSTTGIAGDPLANTIKIVDTRAGGLNWIASALSTQLTKGTDGISAENIGLTGLVTDIVPGNHITTTNTRVANYPAAVPAVQLSDGGSLGLGGTTPHAIASSGDLVNGGTGTIGFTGNLTVTAPTSTKPGHYTGTITFTVV